MLEKKSKFPESYFPKTKNEQEKEDGGNKMVGKRTDERGKWVAITLTYCKKCHELNANHFPRIINFLKHNDSELTVFA